MQAAVAAAYIRVAVRQGLAAQAAAEQAMERLERQILVAAVAVQALRETQVAQAAPVS